MQALGSIAGAIGKYGPTIGKIAQPVIGALGVGRNISGQGTQDALMRRMAAYQAQMAQLANNPAQLAKMIQSLQQPLSTGLQENVMNDVQAQLMQRGLGTSPAIATQVASQALGPYQMQQQLMALQAVMQMLGLPIQAGAAVPPFQPSDTTGFWNQFTGGGTPAYPNMTPGQISGAYGGPTSVPTQPSDFPGTGGGVPGLEGIDISSLPGFSGITFPTDFGAGGQ